MRRWLPHTLFSQMLLILLAGLAMSHLLGMLIYDSDRAQAVRTIRGYAATQQIASLVQLIDQAPPDWRARIVQAASGAAMRVEFSTAPPRFGNGDPESQIIRNDLAAQLPPGMAQQVLARVTRVSGAAGLPLVGPSQSGRPRWGARLRGMMAGGAMMDGGMMSQEMVQGMTVGPRPAWVQRGDSLRSLQAAVELTDGQWFIFTAELPNGAPPTSWPLVAATASMAVIVVAAAAWAVGRIVAPLRTLARAAEHLGRDLAAAPLIEAGTREMRQAAQSFNRMQERIRRLVENRTRMLAALSHDLRTPLTLLRLRAESLPESEDRERMLATISDLNAMIGASLALARDQAVAEARRRTDLAALVASIVDDMADAGLPVSMTPAEPVVLACQAVSLRRAMTNLIDNAIKYGGAARVAMRQEAGMARIDIDDDGPGIPEAEQRRVFEPFLRLEPSRSRETGGTGLGLSIAQQIVEAHGGEITLANRPGGGLSARVSLPL